MRETTGTKSHWVCSMWFIRMQSVNSRNTKKIQTLD